MILVAVLGVQCSLATWDSFNSGLFGHDTAHVLSGVSSNHYTTFEPTTSYVATPAIVAEPRITYKPVKTYVTRPAIALQATRSIKVSNGVVFELGPYNI